MGSDRENCRYCERPLKEEISLSGGGQSIESFTLEGGSGVWEETPGQTQDTVCVSELASVLPQKSCTSLSLIDSR